MEEECIRIKIPFKNQLKEQFSEKEDVERFKNAILEYMIKCGLVITDCPVLFYNDVNKISFKPFGKIEEVYFYENYAIVSTTPELAQLAKNKNAQIAIGYYKYMTRVTSCTLIESKQEAYYEKIE